MKINVDSTKHSDADVVQMEPKDLLHNNGTGDAKHKARFEKNMYTFSANAGRRLKQEIHATNKP